MKIPIRLIGFLFLMLWSSCPGRLSGQGLENPVSWTTAWERVEGSTYKLIFTAEIQEGWYVYSQYLAIPEDVFGPTPTGFYYDEGEHFQRVGQSTETANPLVTEFDNTFEMELTKWYDSARVVQVVEVSNPDIPITGYLEFQTCNEKSCLPPTPVDFSFVLSETAEPADQKESSLDTIDQSISAIQESRTDPVGDCGKSEGNLSESSLGWTFLLGFAGGFLALLTPCVFPMIPLTVSFFTKQSKTRKSGLRNALLYGFSIIVIYVSIGLLITIFFGATALNELSTNWIANVLFFAIFVLFALSFFGFFELTLPSSWANQTDALAEKGGLLGIFFMAFTLAIVSFSCTGPIIGQSLVLSANASLGPFTVMLGFATALALPFALFAAFPAWLAALPKSGGWMNKVKVLLGFLELALALKFLSVADLTKHWGILPYELFLGLWVLIALGMALYLLGLIRFPHDTKNAKPAPVSIALGVAALGLTVYLATGFQYNEKTKAYDPLSLLSGLAPPAQYNLFLPEPPLDPALSERYPSYGKCVNNLDCFKDYEEGLAYAQEVGKPVLLDFTGYGCVNCRKTEEHIWIEDAVWNKIQEDYVLISLYVDDRKPLENELISATRGARLRNVGNKWADFQITNFQQNSQPLYVLLSPEEKVLAHPRGYRESISQYADFLDCGLYTFQRLKSKGEAIGQAE